MKVKRGFRKATKERGKTAVADVPRVARLMALAIRFDQRLRDGVVRDQAELARLGRVAPSRMSQIMGLLQLAPEIQEMILFLEPGRAGITERDVRPIAAMLEWGRQRGMWTQFTAD